MTGITAIPAPQNIEDLGIRRSFIEDLALKHIYLGGELMVDKLAAQLRLSFKVVNNIFESLCGAELCEVKGMRGVSATRQGRARALELLTHNQYSGPTPVPLKDYGNRVRAQSLKNFPVSRARVERAFEHLVLPGRTLKQLGAAVISGTSIFLYGPTGTGKTSIAEAVPSIYHDLVWIPHAVEADGQIITVFDPVVHKPEEKPEAADCDRRWVLCRRPRVIVGGELAADMLDLQFHPVSKFYSAPPQMKANNGVLIVDDFGRQRIRPEELLNRWTVPLDRRIDFLTFLGGRTLEIPFDLFVVFATNLDPAQLADEAFLRRVSNKIKLDNLNREQFHRVFERLCRPLELKCERSIVDDLIDHLTTQWKQPLRPCYPQDLLNHVLWTAQYEGRTPSLDLETLADACRSYFLTPGSRDAQTLHDGGAA